MIAADFNNKESWATSYQRNNKGGGLKNLRCFPFCKAHHVNKGYCGSPVSLNLHLSGNVDLQQVVVVAAFRTTDQNVMNDHIIGHSDAETESVSTHDGEHSKIIPKAFHTGEVLKKAELFRLVSESANVIPKKFFSGELKVEQGNEVLCVFNGGNKGWNYSWHGAKHTTKTMHCLTAFVFVIDDSTGYAECVCECDSPNFTIFSRKKNRRAKRSSGKRKAAEFEEEEEDTEVEDEVVPVPQPVRSPETPRKQMKTASFDNLVHELEVNSPPTILTENDQIMNQMMLQQMQMNLNMNLASQLMNFNYNMNPNLAMIQSLQNLSQIRMSLEQPQNPMQYRNLNNDQILQWFGAQQSQQH